MTSDPQKREPSQEPSLPAILWRVTKTLAHGVRLLLEEAAEATLPEKDDQGPSRTADRNLDRERGVSLSRRERWGTFFVLCSFVVAIGGGISFLVSYWAGSGTGLLGLSLAVSLAGFGVTLVLWSHWLTIHREAVEPREPVSSPIAERLATGAEYACGKRDLRRRLLLQVMSVGGLGVMAAMAMSLFRSLGFSPSALHTRVWKRGERLVDLSGKPVSVHALQPGAMALVFPESSIGDEKSQTVLVRVREPLLRLPSERAEWAPGGYLAYSRVCTHAGCAVGMYEATTHLLMCPCHQSTFDVLSGALPTGGPAARPLPQLPLVVDPEGFLRAAGGFSEPPGPGFWGMQA